MAFELMPDNIAAVNRQQAYGEIVMQPADRLRLKSTPGGTEYFDYQCPPGKRWKLMMSILIVETEV